MSKSYALGVIEEMKPMASRNGMFFVKTHWNHVSVNGVSVTYNESIDMWQVAGKRVKDGYQAFYMAKNIMNAVYKECGWR
ncbi:MAG TPA: hypothetical protein DCW90_09635 [Lachnospiraceae bacterium]|nr:hypothetical protein [Lachnospiraceae bacterium]